MSHKRQVCVITGSRAEYGLLYRLMRLIQDDVGLELQLIVTGMHLSPEFGNTYRQIERDGFYIDRKIESLVSSDTAVGVSKSMGLGIIGFSDALQQLLPNLIVVLGDRFEVFSAACAAMIARIPIAHLHGGEITEGAYDEAMRHSITKMSHLHFTSTEDYRKRVIQLGENPNRVFNVGAIGLDALKNLQLMEKSEFENSIGLGLNKRNLLVTFHPATLSTSPANTQFSELLEAIDDLKSTNIIFTKPNADTDGRVIIRMIDDFVANNSERSVAFESLGQRRYLSALRYVDAVVGNSSSGLIEAPSFRIGTVNIGDRQRGRVKADSIIDCIPERGAIRQAIKHIYSKEFQAMLKQVVNPYELDDTAIRVIDVLRDYPLKNILVKRFFDLSVIP